MKPFISDRATTALVVRFEHPATDKLPCSPAKKMKKTADAPSGPAPKKRRIADDSRSEASGSVAHSAPHQYVDIFGEDEAMANNISMMKSLDTRLVELAKEIDALQVTMKYSIKGDEQVNGKTQYYDLTVMLKGAVPSHPLDRKFAMLSNLCQIERIIKVWLITVKELVL